MRFALVLAVAGGCYRPQDTSCVISCDRGGGCLGSLVCSAGMCGATTTTCTAAPHDAPLAIDASDAASDGQDTLQDAAPEASVADAAVCVGTLAHVCVVSPIGDLVMGGPFNTDGPICTQMFTQQNGAAEMCVMIGNNVTVNNLRVTGARPLAIAALGSMTVQGVLDVSGGTAAGPNSNGGLCPSGTDPVPGNGSAGTGGGGGAGGSYGGSGGSGGQDDPTPAAGGSPGLPTFSAPEVRGGCPGQAGAPGPSGIGLPGRSGGAVLLMANGMIQVNGGIDASGEGGGPGTDQSAAGGGGGGSGGYIGFDAPAVMFMGTAGAFANGGGGGGGDSVSSAIAQPGGDGQENTGPAPGGTGSSMGEGHGGAGSWRSSLAGTDGIHAAAGGGGGGGGAGVIYMVRHNAPVGGMFSPSVQ